MRADLRTKFQKMSGKGQGREGREDGHRSGDERAVGHRRETTRKKKTVLTHREAATRDCRRPRAQGNSARPSRRVILAESLRQGGLPTC